MVVMVIGVIAAIAVPALLGAINRSKQSSTMTEIRSAGQALQMYHGDFSVFPDVNGDLIDLKPFLVPTYVGVINPRDSWGNVFSFATDRSEYTIVSLGSNGARDLPYSLGTTSRFEDDIVFVSGSFYQWPAGIQE